LQLFIEFGLALDTRNEAEYFVSYAGYFLMPLFHEIEKRFYISPKQLRELTDEELLDCLIGKKSIEKVLATKGKYGGWGFDKNIQSLVDFKPDEAQKLFKHIEKYVKPVQGGDENKGMCASPGKVKGTIKIVPTPAQNDKVQDGDILVTYATTVDYLPAMKKAAAFITEIGGLTCHAAVVAREFGVPCIVSLNNAMKNFKDGDLVEVDANKGIVRKLE
jgi:phosphoenolpyruvate synthase/pyruvate phosphate dikinase